MSAPPQPAESTGVAPWNPGGPRPDRQTARIAISQACQDARLNRQTAANLTLAVLVMIAVPASVLGVRRRTQQDRKMTQKGS